MTMEFQQTQLPNGLTIVGETNPFAATAAVGFFVRTGSRDETSGIHGVSHFLEHMMFKGSQTRSAVQVNLDFDRIGADYNAGTTEENTIFYAAVLPEFALRATELLGDILRPALRQEDFDMEKNVILEEIALYEDQPRFRVYDHLMSEYFHNHPLGNSILGTAASITNLRREDMLEYFRGRYAPGNITVAATGQFDFDRLTDQVAKSCLHWPAGEATRAMPPAPHLRSQKVLADPKILREHVGLMSSAPAARDEDRYAAQLVAAVLGDHSGSRLYYALVETAIADEASMSYSAMDGTGAFLTFLSTDTDKARQAVDIARAELGKFMREGPTEMELQAAKNKIASSSTLKGELPMGRLSDMGFDWMYRKQYLPLSRQIERIFDVSRTQVLELARKYDLMAATMLALGPVEQL